MAAATKRPPFAFAKRHGVLVSQDLGDHIEVICREGTSMQSAAEIRRFLGRPIKLQRVPPQQFDSLLQSSYEEGSGEAMEAMEGLDEDLDLASVAQELGEPEDLLESQDDAPIIRLINALLTQAIKENASDIHIEPFENRLTVRFRVDGVL